MYLHIGGNQMIDIRQIVAMFKVHPKKIGKSNPVAQYYKKLVLLNNPGQQIRCYVVTDTCIYGTPISLHTIIERYRQLCRDYQHQFYLCKK